MRFQHFGYIVISVQYLAVKSVICYHSAVTVILQCTTGDIQFFGKLGIGVKSLAHQRWFYAIVKPICDFEYRKSVGEKGFNLRGVTGIYATHMYLHVQGD